MKPVLVASLLVLLVCFDLPAQNCVESTREVYLMGTVARITSCASSRQSGLEQMETMIRIIEDAEAELSTWRPESAVSRLNKTPVGTPFQLNERLTVLFRNLFSWLEKTEGTFDPGIGTLTDAWGIHDEGRIPEKAEIESARANSGLRHFSFDDHNSRIIRTRDARIDVGGFGKGEALDRVVDYAKENGFDPFLIDFGGQIVVRNNAWKVDIASPVNRQQAALSLELREGSLSTSSGSERDVEVEGLRIGHIFDPRSGETIRSNVSATAWHNDGLGAEALSKALYVKGPDEGLIWANENNVAGCFLIPNPGGEVRIRTSAAWRARFGF